MEDEGLQALGDLAVRPAEYGAQFGTSKRVGGDQGERFRQTQVMVPLQRLHHIYIYMSRWRS